MTSPIQHRTIVLALPLLAFVWVCAVVAKGQDFAATFIEPTNTPAVTSYSLWYQPTNQTDINQQTWLGSCLAGTNTIPFYSKSVSGNPVWLTVTANRGTSQSPWSEQFLFDTNNYPLPLNAPVKLNSRRNK